MQSRWLELNRKKGMQTMDRWQSQNRKCMAKMRGEQGFTLTGVLFVVGILSLIAFAAMRFSEFEVAARRQIRSVETVRNMEGAVSQTILRHINRNLAAVNGCINLANSFANLELENAASLRYTQAVPLPDRPPAFMQEAARRCRRPRLPASINNGNDNRIYFCVSFSRDVNSPQGTFLNSEIAFAEVYFELVDLQRGEPLSCSQYVATRDSAEQNFNGGSAMISFYWAPLQESPTQDIRKRRYLTFLGGSN